MCTLCEPMNNVSRDPIRDKLVLGTISTSLIPGIREHYVFFRLFSPPLVPSSLYYIFFHCPGGLSMCVTVGIIIHKKKFLLSCRRVNNEGTHAKAHTDFPHTIFTPVSVNLKENKPRVLQCCGRSCRTNSSHNTL